MGLSKMQRVVWRIGGRLEAHEFSVVSRRHALYTYEVKCLARITYYIYI